MTKKKKKKWKYWIQRVIIGDVCSWRFPGNSFTEISFTTMVYGEDTFFVFEDF